MLKLGWNCLNHVCIIHFLNLIGFYDVKMIDSLRKLRNQINYRGDFADPEFLIKNHN